MDYLHSVNNTNVEYSDVTDPVQHVRPSLHSDTLEHCQHGKQEVVEVGDAAIGAVPAFSTLRIVQGAGTAVTVYCTGSRVVFCCYSYTRTHTHVEEEKRNLTIALPCTPV